MNISNVTSLSELYNLLQINNSNNQQSYSPELLHTTENKDSVSISAEGMAYSKMPPPPESIDFESMSDDELMSYLEEMQNVTGNIPGMEAGTSVSELSDEALESIRELLEEMSSLASSQDINRPMGPPPQQITVTNESSEDQTQYEEASRDQNSYNAAVLNAISAYSTKFAYI